MSRGAAIRSPISPIEANLHMEKFEVKAMRSSDNPPRLWMRYVDDTFVIQQTACKKKFLKPFNSIDPRIRLRTE